MISFRGSGMKVLNSAKYTGTFFGSMILFERPTKNSDGVSNPSAVYKNHPTAFQRVFTSFFKQQCVRVH